MPNLFQLYVQWHLRVRHPADRTLGERRKLKDKYYCDGMALDVEGNLMIIGFQSDHVVRIQPDGGELPPLETPAKKRLPRSALVELTCAIVT
jgi:sugar lactone lactonase YvrE